MNNSQKQNRTNVQRDLNTHKHSNLFMLLGLLLALLTMYVAIEFKIPVNNYTNKPNWTTPVDDDPLPPEIIIKEPVVQTPPEIPLVKYEPDVIKIVDNSTATDDNFILTTVDDTPKKTIDEKLNGIVEVPTTEELTKDFISIEKAPVFPGCEGSNEAIKNCFSEQVHAFVMKNFNIAIVQDLGLTPGKKRVNVAFVVDSSGKIVEVNVRAPHTALAKEAERVIHLLPVMQPAQQQEDKVRVKFYLPITLDVLEQ